MKQHIKACCGPRTSKIKPRRRTSHPGKRNPVRASLRRQLLFRHDPLQCWVQLAGGRDEWPKHQLCVPTHFGEVFATSQAGFVGARWPCSSRQVFVGCQRGVAVHLPFAHRAVLCCQCVSLNCHSAQSQFFLRICTLSTEEIRVQNHKTVCAVSLYNFRTASSRARAAHFECNPCSFIYNGCSLNWTSQTVLCRSLLNAGMAWTAWWCGASGHLDGRIRCRSGGD